LFSSLRSKRKSRILIVEFQTYPLERLIPGWMNFRLGIFKIETITRKESKVVGFIGLIAK
jgi:hypothetical protein